MIQRSRTFFLTLFFMMLSLFCCITSGYADENEREISSESLTKALSDAVVRVGEKAIPAVVYIEAEVSSRKHSYHSPRHQRESREFQNPFTEEFFRHFFGVEPPKENYPQVIVQKGSGFLISCDGNILTNAHIIKGAKNSIKVTLNDGSSYQAKILGKDSNTDLAVLKMESDRDDFPFIALGNSDDTRVGEFVVAIGNPFGIDFAASLTSGVISAKGRNLDEYSPSKKPSFTDFIQTDAAINTGNSGGPLLNLNGEVIGINTAIISPNGGFLGMGFAIPSNIAHHVMDKLIESGGVDYGYLGISVAEISEEVKESLKDRYNFDGKGLEVTQVSKGTPAEKSGLKTQDIIIQLDGEDMLSKKQLAQKIRLLEPGTTIHIVINRKGKLKNIKVTLGSHPNSSVRFDSVKEIGFEIINLTEELREHLGYKNEQGVIISKVYKPHLRLQKGLLITEVEGYPISGPEEFYEQIGNALNRLKEKISDKSEERSTKNIFITVSNGTFSRYVPITIKTSS